MNYQSHIKFKTLFNLIFWGLLVLFPLSIYSQKEANIWYFGDHAGLDFNSGAPVALTNSAMYQAEGCSSISDQNGEILFYTNGVKVWNKNHALMQNGTGLVGNSSSTQSSLVIPNPSGNGIFYIFTVDAIENNLSAGFRYSIVDLNQNGGLGNVMSKNNLLFSPSCEKVTAVKHYNGTDYWVIAHKWESNSYYSYLVTVSGVSSPVISDAGMSHSGYIRNAIGYMKTSPAGDRIAVAIESENKVEVLDFNNQTGIISNPINFPCPNNQRTYGVEFSPDGTKLYIDSWDPTGSIYQFDLQAGTPGGILNSAIEIYSGGGIQRSALQLGPDLKIYVARRNKSYIGVINNPNEPGLDCNYVDQGVNLAGKTSLFGLPTFIQSFFLPGQDFNYLNDCYHDTTFFNITNTNNLNSVYWDFDDPSSGPANYSTELNPYHIFTSPGLFNVKLISYFTSNTDTVIKSVLIYPSPEINLGSDTLICSGDSLFLNAGSGFSTYLWSTGSADSVIVIDTSGVFWVEVTNEFGCSSIDSIFVDYYPFAFEDLELGNDTSFCYGDVFVLNAGTGYTYYEWQNGSHDSIFIADTTGVYWVYVSNPCGEAWDTINLSLYPITEIDLGNDTAVCFGEFILLDPGADFISYLWQDGSINQFIYAGQTGIYWVQVTDSNYCTVTDSVNLEFILPDPDIGNDTTICFGDTITFFSSDEFVSYLWQDGSVGLSFTADTSGIFWCEVTDTLGCVGVDSVCLNLIYPPLVSLGNDTSICTGDSIWLSVGLSGEDYEILWQDGSSDSAFTTSKSGIYWVQVSNICGTDTDSVYITLLPLPEIFLGNDIIIGIRDDILLDAGLGFESYLWNDGSTFQTLTVSDPGYYWVNVFDGQCYNSDTINIEPINCDMFIPIVFTPNGDIYNNYFYADASEDITDFELVVYNRWGEKMWETNDLYDKWDGTKNGNKCAEGVYYWLVEYKCLGAYHNFTLKGSVTLLR